MKKIKYFLWLIVLGLLGILIYQNLDYFMATNALKFDLKIPSWNWTIPEIQNIAYFGICFVLGVFLVGFRGLIIKFKLKKEIKTKDAAIASFKEKITALKTELDVFQHDPYLKKETEQETIIKQPEPVHPDYVQPEPVIAEPVQPDYIPPETITPEPVQPDYEEPESVESEPVESEPVQPDYVPSENDNKKDTKPDSAD